LLIDAWASVGAPFREGNRDDNDGTPEDDATIAYIGLAALLAATTSPTAAEEVQVAIDGKVIAAK
jgi:hypothetical protein